MSIINSGSASPRNLSHLDKLVEENASAFRVGSDGKLESSYTMAFRSGLNYAFGIGKSDDDKIANKQTLTFLLGEIENNTSQSVREALMNRTLKLAGDDDGTKYTVMDRLQRGTYVSSELIRQLQCMATKIHHAEQENKALVAGFFGQNADNATERYAELGSGFSQIIRQIQDRGTPDYPQKQAAFWKHFGDYFLDGIALSKRGEELLRNTGDKGVFQAIDQLVAEKSAVGKALDIKVLTQFVMHQLVARDLHATFARDFNREFLNNLGPEGFAAAVSDWLKATNDKSGITQNDCDWLAGELIRAGEAGDQLSLTGDNSLLARVAAQMKGIFGGERFDANSIILKIQDTVRENANAERLLPGNWGPQIDRVRSPEKQFAVEQKRTLSPKLLDRTEVARLMEDSVKPILLARHERLNEIQNEEIAARSDKSRELLRNIAPFFELKKIANQWLSNRDRDPQFDRINQPTSASAFAKAVLLRPILVAKHRQTQFDVDDDQSKAAMDRKMKLGFASFSRVPIQTDDGRTISRPTAEETRLSNENLAQQAEIMRAAVMAMEGGMSSLLDQNLPVLDRFSSFKREVEAARLQLGGIGGLSGSDLARLKKEAVALKADAEDLKGIAKMLDAKYLGLKGGELDKIKDLEKEAVALNADAKDLEGIAEVFDEKHLSVKSGELDKFKAEMLDAKHLSVKDGELYKFKDDDRNDIIAELRQPVVALQNAADLILFDTQYFIDEMVPSPKPDSDVPISATKPV